MGGLNQAKNYKTCAPYGDLAAIIVLRFPFEISSPRFACLGGLTSLIVLDNSPRLCVWLGIKLSRFPSSLLLFAGAWSRSPQPYSMNTVYGITSLKHRYHISLDPNGSHGHVFIEPARSTCRDQREVG